MGRAGQGDGQGRAMGRAGQGDGQGFISSLIRKIGFYSCSILLCILFYSLSILILFHLYSDNSILEYGIHRGGPFRTLFFT
jgi:hypothetical protein